MLKKRGVNGWSLCDRPFWYDTDMFRTKDLLLVGVVIVFLVSGIGLTLSVKKSESTTVAPQALTGEPVSTTVALPADNTPTIAENRLRMQEKIAAYMPETRLLDSEPEQSEEVVYEEEIVAEEILASSSQKESQNCPNPAFYVGAWPSDSRSTVVQEGVPVVLEQHGTTTVPVVQLPQFVQNSYVTCPYSDVVGVTTDGVLIHNTDVDWYSVFMADTLIGYALDGAPIYGRSAAQLDECGGRIFEGVYRYELQDSRKTVIGCFGGTPVQLP